MGSGWNRVCVRLILIAVLVNALKAKRSNLVQNDIHRVTDNDLVQYLLSTLNSDEEFFESYPLDDSFHQRDIIQPDSKLENVESDSELASSQNSDVAPLIKFALGDEDVVELTEILSDLLEQDDMEAAGTSADRIGEGSLKLDTAADEDDTSTSMVQNDQTKKEVGFQSIKIATKDSTRDISNEERPSTRNDKQEFRSLHAEHESTQKDASGKRNPAASLIPTNSDDLVIRVGLPGISIKKDDTYLCTTVRIDDYLREKGKPIYIKKYVPHAKQTVAHHMLLYGCQRPGSFNYKVWDCSGVMGSTKSKYPSANVCGGGQETILWAWAKNAPAFSLPEGIGFKVGDTSNVNYLVLQVHYKSASVFKGGRKDYSSVSVIASRHQMPRIAGVYVLATSLGSIPPHKTRNLDIYCRYKRSFAIHPFAFRTHAHALGRKVIGYRIRNGIWTLIGEKNPQLPEEFYTVANNATIRNGDILAARCVMHNFRNVRTHIGYRHTDEMCNFYIMFWTDKQNERKLDEWYKSCGNGYPWVHWSQLPGYNAIRT